MNVYGVLEMLKIKLEVLWHCKWKPKQIECINIAYIRIKIYFLDRCLC